MTDASLRVTTQAMLVFLPAFAAYPDWFLRGARKLKHLAIANASVTFLWLVGVLLIVGGRQPSAYALAYAVSPLGGAAVFWLPRRDQLRGLRNVHPGSWLGHLRVSSSFALAGILAGSSIPLVLSGVGWMGSAADVGAYTIGLRIAAIAGGAVWVVLLNLTPEVVRRNQNKDALGLTLVFGLVGVLSFATIVAVTPNLLIPLIGESYRAGMTWLLLGSAMIVPWSAKFAIETALIARLLDRERIMVSASTLVAVALAALLAHLLRTPSALPIGYAVGELGAMGMGAIHLHARRGHSSVSALVPDDPRGDGGTLHK